MSESLDYVVELSEDEFNLQLLTGLVTCPDEQHRYEELFNVLSMYKECGLGLRYYRNCNTDEYLYVPFVKRVGFIQDGVL
jgi:hypothetical protein